MLKLYVFLLIKHSKAVKKQKIGKANFNFQQKYLCHKALCKVANMTKLLNGPHDNLHKILPVS